MVTPNDNATNYLSTGRAIENNLSFEERLLDAMNDVYTGVKHLTASFNFPADFQTISVLPLISTLEGREEDLSQETLYSTTLAAAKYLQKNGIEKVSASPEKRINKAVVTATLG